MSSVTGTCLFMALLDEERIPEINEWFKGTKRWFPMTELSERVGGNKHPQMLILAGGHNYFDEEEFWCFLVGLKWEMPENVMLVTQGEHQDGYTVRKLPTATVSAEQLKNALTGADA